MEMMSMDMNMNMMMDLDKLPDPFSMPIFQEFPDIEFSGGSTTSTESPPSIIYHSPPPPPPPPHVTTPSLTPIFELPHLQKPNSSSVEAMREMIFQMAAMQPVQIDPESVKPPRRKNVKISKDPQSVAARHRRERISERIRILQRLVPGGTKMDTASMLDEAVHYMKFLKKQVQSLEEQAASNMSPITMGGGMGVMGYPTTMNYSAFSKACGQITSSQMVGSMQMLR